jgi:HAD superfamily hydrolase (TIGR01459 family)
VDREDMVRIVPQISGLSEISDRYDAVLCDIWGVVHNGLTAFRQASDALVTFRQKGGVVVFVTNAPRPSPPIHDQLLTLGVAAGAFDAIATSGDVTIGLIVGRIDEPVLHIGPDRDLSLFDAAAKRAGREPRRASLDEARYALCTGLRHDITETPESYDAELQVLAERGVLMVCANPDLVIHRGDTMIYCAGALAQRFEALGGDVVYAGKPYARIYDHALSLGENALGRPLDKKRVLAIGDGMKTDIAGATAMGLDSLFVTHGIHREVLHGETLGLKASAENLSRICAEYGFWPIAAISSLRD